MCWRDRAGIVLNPIDTYRQSRHHESKEEGWTTPVCQNLDQRGGRLLTDKPVAEMTSRERT